MRFRWIRQCAISLTWILLLVVGCGAPDATPTPQPTITSTASPSPTPEPEATIAPEEQAFDHFQRGNRLAAQGVRFETVISSTSWTLPAHMAMLTSLPDIVHGVIWDDKRLDPNRITLAERLKNSGYQTCGVITAPYMLPMFGFSQGFDFYFDATGYDKSLTSRPDILIASQHGHTTPGALMITESPCTSARPRPKTSRT